MPAKVTVFLGACSSNDANSVLSTLGAVLVSQQMANAVRYDINPQIMVATAQSTADASAMSGSSTNAAGGPKRPLNSFMAFRKYYSTSLAGLPQKSISKIMVILWRNDPLKAKWAMLAKAYSVLRGNKEKYEVPLSDFFDTCAPLVGVIPAEEYMTIMGWKVYKKDGVKEQLQEPVIVRLFTPDFDEFPVSLTTTVWSVNDLVKHAASMGVAGYAAQAEAYHDGGMEALSMIVQPASTLHLDSPSEQSIGNNESSSGRPLELIRYVSNTSGLSDSTMLLDNQSSVPYSVYFDPGTNINLTYDPAARGDDLRDRGRFEAYNLEHAVPVSGNSFMLDLSEYVHDDLELAEGDI